MAGAETLPKGHLMYLEEILKHQPNGLMSPRVAENNLSLRLKMHKPLLPYG